MKASKAPVVQEFENTTGNSIAETDIQVGRRFVMAEIAGDHGRQGDTWCSCVWSWWYV